MNANKLPLKKIDKPELIGLVIALLDELDSYNSDRAYEYRENIIQLAEDKE